MTLEHAPVAQTPIALNKSLTIRPQPIGLHYASASAWGFGMDVFTMVVVACVAGETICSQARISEINFTTAEICESRVDDVANSMVKEFAQDARLKGKEVTFEVTCMNRQQMRVKLGVIQTDM